MSVLYLRPNLRRWLRDFCLEVWLKFNLKNARFELEKFEEARRSQVAAQWRGLVKNLEEQLKEMGVDPDKIPEDLTKTLEVYFMLAFVLLAVVIGVLINLCRAELFQLLK